MPVSGVAVLGWDTSKGAQCHSLNELAYNAVAPMRWIEVATLHGMAFDCSIYYLVIMQVFDQLWSLRREKCTVGCESGKLMDSERRGSRADERCGAVQLGLKITKAGEVKEQSRSF